MQFFKAIAITACKTLVIVLVSIAVLGYFVESCVSDLDVKSKTETTTTSKDGKTVTKTTRKEYTVNK